MDCCKSFGLHIAAGRWGGTAHVVRADRLCPWCDAGALDDEQQKVLGCVAVAPVGQTYADMFTSGIDSTRTSFVQRDHPRVFRCGMPWSFFDTR